MPRARDLLYRFRPAGAPGAASATAVPLDREADLAEELQPLFAQLASTETECAAIRAAGRRDASDIRERETERARGIVAGANGRMTAERAAASADAQQQAVAVTDALLAAAESDAEAVRARVEERLPEYVDRVVRSVLEMLDEAQPSEAQVRR